MKPQINIVVGLSVVCLLSVCPVQGAKILLISSQTYSHCLEIGSVGQELANRGHDVVILLYAKFKHNNCYDKGHNGTNKIRTIYFDTAPGDKGLEELEGIITRSAGEELSFPDRLNLLNSISWYQCSAVFSDQKALDAIKKEQFDLAIIDTLFVSYCFFVIPYKLGIRYVALSTVIEDIVSTRPFLPSIVPDMLTQFTDRMTFFQRLINAIAPMFFHVFIVRRNIPMDVVAKIAPELSARDVIDLVSKSELFLYNYDTVLSYPVPTMPNQVLVGGIGARIASPLSGIFKEFYQKATNGVVVVSQGSTVNSLPPSVKGNLIAALKRLNIDVLWRDTEKNVDGKIKRVKWLPQNDVLGHPKTRLFVSHCGNNGVSEALYHGVPLVCTPMDNDQFYHGIRVQRWNAGKTVPLKTSSEDTLFGAINEVLNNSTYKANMKRASEIYHSRPENARERAAFWIEHVLKFGGDHLKSQAADMSVFTYRGYDVICFILICLILVVLLIIKAVLILYGCCCRSKSVKVKTN